MKQILSALALLWALNIVACNSCGCYTGMVGSSVRQYGGNITVFSGINHISFRSIHPGDIVNPQEYTSYEYFNSAYLGVSKHLGKSFYADVIVPYKVNHYQDFELSSYTGIGDIQVGLNKLITRFSDKKERRWQLFANMQLSVPSGKVYDNAPNVMLQPGRQNLGISPGAQLSVAGIESLILVNAKANFNTWQQATEFGNGFNLSALYGYNVWHRNKEMGSATFMLAGEIEFFYSQPNKLNGRELPDNNGTFTMANLNLIFQQERLNINLKSGIPVVQNISNGNTEVLFYLQGGVQFKIK